uniref:Uncharacterized protein n=1 Tax=Solanum lycopersicum TaxID=4081 RepID=A0A3Q7H7U2_SOLLC
MDDLYFNSSNPGSDIYENEGDPVDSDEVVDPPLRISNPRITVVVKKSKNTIPGKEKNGYTTGGGYTGDATATSIGVSGGVTGGARGDSNGATGDNGGATTSATSTGVTGGSGGTTTKRPATTSTAYEGATTATTTASRSANIQEAKNREANNNCFVVLFGANDDVIKRSGTIDRELHSTLLKSSVLTNIDLDYKPNGLRWKGGTTITQRKLQEQSYK